ncbi:MAG: Gldg family protein [Lentisphaeria bacterium]|nr:Gldg family protein [Lentisphaeria bacterium]
MTASLRRIFAVASREFFASLASPAAWVFLVIFLVMANVCTFVFSDILALGQAELSPFFNWMPWLFMFLMPALGMPLWAEERRTGTFELTLSYPVSLWELVFGKYLAGMALVAAALALTLPVPATIAVLGEPDIGAIVCGYAGALLVGSAFLAVSSFCSALSKSQTASFLLALLLCALLMFTGWDRVTGLLYQWLPESVCRLVSYCTVVPHYQAFQRGLFDTSELVYSVLITLLFLYFARTVLAYAAANGGGLFLPGALRDRYTWKNVLSMALSFIAAVYVFICLALTAEAFRIRIDCTADRAYSLSPEARALARSLERHTTVRLYVSPPGADTPKDLLGYAERVKWLLREFSKEAGGKVTLEIISPGPDTREEEAAIIEGLQPAKNAGGERFFLGMTVSAGQLCLAAPFLSPKNESMLEYELLRRILHVQDPKRPVVGVISPFPVLGRAPSPQTGSAGAAAWYLFTELNKDYTLKEVPTDIGKIPDELDALLVVHPHDFDRRTLEAIDAYLVNGGRLAVFVDPLSAYALASAQKDYSYVNMTDSTLEPLLTAWGVSYSPSRLAADMNFKYDQLDKSGVRRTIPTALCITEAGIGRGNPVTGGLTSLRMNYAGFFSLRNPPPSLAFEPLVYTTDYCMPADVADQPEQILADFPPPGQGSGGKLDLLMHITGQFPSAYGRKDAGKPGEVYLFGDADMLFHDACVAQAKDEFGQTIVVRSNDNITLMENVVESLCGGGRLSSLRSRIPMSRPLTRIIESQMRADLAFKDRILALAEESIRLEQRVESIRKQLIVSGGTARLTQEQRDLLNTYEQKDAALKREIREIRLQLRQDLDRINNTVRLINIFLIPAFVVLCGIAWSTARKLKWKRHIS